MRLQWTLLAVLAASTAARLVPRQETTSTPTTAPATTSATTTTSSSSSAVTSSSTTSSTGSTTSTSSSTTGTWTGVNSDGSLSTHTASVSTKDGTPTTVDAPTGTNVLEDGERLVCSNTDGKFKPFCTPNNNATWYVGDRYAVSWDTKYYGNDNLQVLIIYTDVQQNAGIHAWESSMVQANSSVAFLTVDKAWLQGRGANNVTVQLKYVGRDADTGPRILITNKPPPPSEPAKPRPLGVIIGVPVAMVTLLVLTLGVCFAFRKHRHIGIGNIMSRRRGYATRKSKRQRMGAKEAIQMETMPESRPSNEWEIENVRGDTYRDEPRNAFRDEIARQNA